MNRMVGHRAVVIFVVFTASIVALSQADSPELLINGGFEQDRQHWETCWNYHCEVTLESHSGSKALKVTGRTQYYQGPTQTINLDMGKRYAVEGWVKLLNNDHDILQYIEIEISETLTNGKTDYLSVARRPFLTAEDGWIHLAGDFVTPTTGLKSARLYLQGPNSGIDFIVDDLSLKEIPEVANWRTEADKRIEKIRKSDINFVVSLPNGVKPESVELEINQTTNGFAFGTEVNAHRLVSSSPENRKYAQFLYDNYNWGVPGNALKWYEFESNRGHPDWDWGYNAVQELVKHGINVRAHNMLWAVEQFVPRWLKNLPRSEVRTAVAKHIKETALRYKGLVKHWDVNNELLHGNWYETKLNDTEYTKDVFRMIHHWDPNVKLFLNDYNTVGSGGATEAYTQQGSAYKKFNTHIYGMGVQSHFPSGIAPDPTMVLRRLDRLAGAGLPLWSTELDVKTPDENLRADWYEIAMRVLFSHPAVEGIVMWGFWSQAHYAGEQASLVSGPDFRVNSAGKRYIDLVHRQWRTHVTRSLASGTKFHIRGFHGNYNVIVRINGKVVQREHFSLGKTPANVHFTVQSH
ncbi:uncharacterized protein LOC135469112 [Liolophura sinensis]|uniref:uncharacterized protein LOC135469112 n=1 Tax=Liolophura sinensis TaxID=3198878 RepID=UPI003158E39E